ncbi:MAG: hypothetical protein ABI745_05300 [Caldimonas sp.]
MAVSASSVVVATARGAVAAAACAWLLCACGQKGGLVPAEPIPVAKAASSPDTLPIPGVSPADLPAPVPQR